MALNRTVGASFRMLCTECVETNVEMERKDKMR